MAGQGIWDIDAETSTAYANIALGGMLGYGPDRMIGQSVFAFMDATAAVEAVDVLGGPGAGKSVNGGISFPACECPRRLDELFRQPDLHQW